MKLKTLKDIPLLLPDEDFNPERIRERLRDWATDQIKEIEEGEFTDSQKEIYGIVGWIEYAFNLKEKVADKVGVAKEDKEVN